MRAIMPIVITFFLVTQTKFTSESDASYKDTHGASSCSERKSIWTFAASEKSQYSLCTFIIKNSAQHLPYLVTLS